MDLKDFTEKEQEQIKQGSGEEVARSCSTRMD